MKTSENFLQMFVISASSCAGSQAVSVYWDEP